MTHWQRPRVEAARARIPAGYVALIGFLALMPGVLLIQPDGLPFPALLFWGIASILLIFSAPDIGREMLTHAGQLGPKVTPVLLLLLALANLACAAYALNREFAPRATNEATQSSPVFRRSHTHARPRPGS